MQKHNFDVDIVIPSTKQQVKINAENIEIGSTKIACSAIEAVKYGVSLVGSVKNPSKKIYTIAVKSKDGKTATIQFESTKVTQLLEEDHTYAYIMSGLWHYVKKELVSSFIDKLNNKEFIQVGTAKFNHQGFEMFSKTWFWSKPKAFILPWSQVKHSLDKGIFCIQDQYKRKNKIKLSLHEDWNAVVLQTLMHYLAQENRCQKLEQGSEVKSPY